MKLRERIAKLFLAVFLLITIHGFTPHNHHDYEDDECQLSALNHQHGHHHHNALDLLHMLMEYHSHTDFEDTKSDLWIYSNMVSIEITAFEDYSIPETTELAVEFIDYIDSINPSDPIPRDNPHRGPPVLV